MRQLLALTSADLLQRVRDKSVVIFALVVPMALMTVSTSSSAPPRTSTSSR